MKRTPLHRTKSLTRRTKLRPVNRKRRARLHERNFGKQAELCRSLSCSMCGAPPPNDPHHLKARGFGGVKSNDDQCVSLCRRCHDDVHRLGRAAWTRRGIDPTVILERIRKLVKIDANDLPIALSLGRLG